MLQGELWKVQTAPLTVTIHTTGVDSTKGFEIAGAVT